MKKKKLCAIVATALCTGIMAAGSAAGAGNPPPGWYGGPPPWPGYQRYMSEEDVRRAMREEREAISARHQWREADRGRRDTFWRDPAGARGWPGNNPGDPPAWNRNPRPWTGYRP